MATPSDAAFSEATECALCCSPLEINVSESDGGSLSMVPDDVEIPCRRKLKAPGHHFHWACIEDLHESGDWEPSRCPFSACNGNPLDSNGKLLVTVRNEGGVTHDFDLLEAFEVEKDDNLPRRKEIAMLEAARSGDWEFVESLLSEGVNPNAVEDDNGITALHIAAFLGDSGSKMVETCLKCVS